MNKLPVPQYAKEKAREGLNERKQYPPSKKPGLDKEQARKLGINSGVERAKQLIKNKSIPKEDAKRVAAFYNRFRNKRTKRAETAIDLWGGRKFGKKAVEWVKKNEQI